MNKAELVQLGFDMMQWHSSGSDPIYAAGSYLGAGLVPDLLVCKAAVVNLEACVADDQAAANELAKVLSRLDRYIAERENLTTRQMEDLVAHLILFPRSAEYLTTLTTPEAQQIERALEQFAVNAGAAATYVGVLSGTDGTGRHSYQDAVKHGNKIAVKIRKAFGYTLSRHRVFSAE